MTRPGADPDPAGRPTSPARAISVEPMRWWDIDAVVALEQVLFPGDSPWTPGMFWAELAAGHHYVVHRGETAPETADVERAGAATADTQTADTEIADTATVAVGTVGAGTAAAGSVAPSVLGYAGLAIGPDTADVQTIGVAPAAQHRGIGRALLRDLLAAAGDLPVMLEVRTDNAPAIELYESEGFATLGLRRRYYQPSGADAFTMRRPSRTGQAPQVPSVGSAIGGRR